MGRWFLNRSEEGCGGVGVWGCGGVGVWGCGGVGCGGVGVWGCGGVGVWGCGGVGVWGCGGKISEFASKTAIQAMYNRFKSFFYTPYPHTPTPPHLHTPISPYPHTPILPNFLILPLLLALLTFPASAQDLPYAKMIVDSLTSPAFGGRAYDDDGDGKAASFIQRQYVRHGLLPVFDGREKYEQEFTLPFDTFLETPQLAINGTALRAGYDMLPYASSPSGQSENSRVVYAGSGLIVPEMGINDYEGLDMGEAMVVIDDQIADSIRNHPDVQGPALALSSRIQIAAHLGARGLVVVTDNNLSYGWVVDNAPIPTFIVRRDVLPKEIDSVGFRVNTVRDSTFTTTNVAGILPGREFPHRYLVVMAHYDHLGRLGDEVYFPGANDNASGVALMLSLARAFSTYQNRYSIVFVAFSGEEQGLRGSRHFVENPPFPLDSIEFLINVDMVASGEDGLMAVGGSDFEQEFSSITNINNSLAIAPLGKRRNAPNSDHYFFLQNGVHGFFIYTNKGKQPYHHPLDLPETLEWDDFSHVFELTRRFLIRLDGE